MLSTTCGATANLLNVRPCVLLSMHLPVLLAAAAAAAANHNHTHLATLAALLQHAQPPEAEPIHPYEQHVAAAPHVCRHATKPGARALQRSLKHEAVLSHKHCVARLPMPKGMAYKD
jgi:hypothetical protein